MTADPAPESASTHPSASRESASRESATPSIAARLMPLVMAVRGSKRQFSTADATLRRMRQLQLRPARFGPPRFLTGVDIEVTSILGWPVYTVTPRGGAVPRRAVYLHGGAYVFEITMQHWQLVAHLAIRTGTRFTVPIYPLAPAATASTIVPAVANLAATLIAEVGADRVTIMGDSAGGGMALAVALQLRDRAREHSADAAQPGGAQPGGAQAGGAEASTAAAAQPRTILISPWLDISGTDPQLAVIAPRDPWLAVPGSHAAGAVYRGELGEDDPMVSPINGDLEGLGRITMFSGTRDILNADAARLVARARTEDIPLDYHEAPEMIHVWPLLPIPEARTARATIASAMVAGA